MSVTVCVAVYRAAGMLVDVTGLVKSPAYIKAPKSVNVVRSAPPYCNVGVKFRPSVFDDMAAGNALAAPIALEPF